MIDEAHLEIILLAEDDDVAAELQVLSDDAFTRESSGFDGLDSVVVTFATLGLPLISLIGKIVIEQVRAKKFVKLRYGDTTIEGVSEAKVNELLEFLQRNAGK